MSSANLRAARPTRVLHADGSSANLEDVGRKGPQFLTMTRADYAAYEYLCRQIEAKEWIENILQEKLDEDFWKATADGTVLCRMANAMWPGAVPKYNGPNSYRFKLNENISMFLHACSSHGLAAKDLFTELDLFEKKNMPAVVNCLQKLAELVAKQGFTVHWKRKGNVDFSPKEIQEAKKLEGVNLWQKKASSASIEETGTKKKKSLMETEDPEAEVKKKQIELEQQEAKRKKEEEEARLLKEKEELEAQKRKEEEEKRRKKQEEEIEVARVQKHKEKENQLIKKREDEERKRKKTEKKKKRGKKKKLE